MAGLEEGDLNSGGRSDIRRRIEALSCTFGLLGECGTDSRVRPDTRKFLACGIKIRITMLAEARGGMDSYKWPYQRGPAPQTWCHLLAQQSRLGAHLPAAPDRVASQPPVE